MLAPLRFPILLTAALQAILSLSGQTDSSILATDTGRDGRRINGTAVPKETDSGTPIPTIRLNSRQCLTCSFTYRSGIKERLRVVIRDPDAWRDVWKAINEGRLPLPRLPEIDFSREMVIVVGLGERRTGGYSIVVDRVYATDNQLEVLVVNRSPGANCLVTLALTQPVDIARLPRTERPVVFRETETVSKCR